MKQGAARHHVALEPDLCGLVRRCSSAQVAAPVVGRDERLIQGVLDKPPFRLFGGFASGDELAVGGCVRERQGRGSAEVVALPAFPSTEGNGATDTEGARSGRVLWTVHRPDRVG